jgi:hypothetical protein
VRSQTTKFYWLHLVGFFLILFFIFFILYFYRQSTSSWIIVGRIGSNSKNKKAKSTQNYENPFVTSTFQSLVNACNPSTKGKYKQVEACVMEEEEVELDFGRGCKSC